MKQTNLFNPTERSIYVYTYTHTTGKDRARLQYLVAMLHEFTRRSLTQNAITDYKNVYYSTTPCWTCKVRHGEF